MHRAIYSAAILAGVAAVIVAHLYVFEVKARWDAEASSQARITCLDELYSALGILDKIDLCLADGHLTQDDFTTLAAAAKK